MRLLGGIHKGNCWIGLCLLLMITTVCASSQTGQAVLSSPAAISGGSASDYLLGPGDLVNITFTNSPELSGKYRVMDSGDLAVPLLTTPVKAEGLTAMELGNRIAEALKAAKQLRDPIVTVFVEEKHGRSVTVVGAVEKPSVYPLERPATLLEVLSLAGGTTPAAGPTLTVVRKAVSNGNSTQQIELSRLMRGEDPSLNVEVRAGDIVSVSTAPVIYVVGAVMKPGAFVVQDASVNMTLLQALATAEGMQPVAARNRLIIFRQLPGAKERENILIDSRQLMTGKLADPSLQPNDIVFVPESGTKKTLQVMARTAEQAIVGVATYGAGLRIGGR